MLPESEGQSEPDTFIVPSGQYSSMEVPPLSLFHCVTLALL